MELLDVLRQEKKYLLHIIRTKQLESLLTMTLNSDSHNRKGEFGNKGYMVRSLYFDTIDNTDYIEKIDGIGERRKIRIRIYDTNAQYTKLELKEKQGDFQRKRSLLITKRETEELIEGKYECLLNREEEFAHEIYGKMKEKVYLPKCIVEYERKAWFVPENDIRITLDSSIRATESNFDLFSGKLLLYPVSDITTTTLEVKFNHFMLSYVRDLLSLHEETQVSASKYCMARSVGMRGID